LIIGRLARHVDIRVVAASILLAGSLLLANHTYFVREWPGDLFTTNGGNATAIALVVALVTVVGALVPKRFDTPGGAVALLLFAFVYVPTTSITLGQSGWLGFVPEVLALTVGMCVAAIAASLATRRIPGENILPNALFVGLVTAWVIATITLIIEHGSSMSIVGIKDTYTQREAGRATSIWIAYTQTYYLNVICPGLLAFALTNRKFLWAFAPAVIGFTVIYAVNAQKMAVIIPVLMISFGAISRVRSLTNTWVFLSAIATACLLSLIHYQFVAGGGSLPAAIVLHRTFGIPAMTLHWYYDTFTDAGYTLWSHVRGISWFVAPPPNLGDDPLWPNLGYIIGERVLGNPINNVNANLFSSDGAAGAGLAGIICISFVAGIWITALNYTSRGWNSFFAISVIIPVALTLTNGPFFTILLSFGGLFWPVVFESFWRLRNIGQVNQLGSTN
jgi:hypothetical protein